MSSVQKTPRILILGGTGMLGHKLWQRLPARFEDVWVTVRKRKRDYARFGNLFAQDHVIDGLDVLDFSHLQEVLETLKPSVIVNAIGVTKRLVKDESDPQAIELNARFPHRLDAWAAKNHARVIQISTDCVFDGRLGGYLDDDVPNARDLYGKTKGEGELRSSNSLTLRSSFIGREVGHFTELAEWALAQKGKTIHGFDHAIYSGMTTLEFTRILGEVIENAPHLCGIYNLAGPEITKFELLSLLNREFDLGMKIERDSSVGIRRNLNGKKFETATGIKIRSWPEMIHELRQDPTPYEMWRSA